MKENVMLLNGLKYDTDKGKGTRIGLIFIDEDKIQETDKFIGYSEVSLFYPEEVFDKLNKDLIGVPLVANIGTKSNPRNPLQTRQLITSLETDNGVIDFV